MVESSKTLIVPLIRNLPEKSGGIQKGVFQLYNDLRHKGFDIEFILDSETKNFSEYDGFKINHLKFPSIFTYPFTKRYFEYIKYRKKIYNHFKNNYKERKVIVIAHWAPDFMLLGEIGFKFNCKTVFCFEGPYHTKKFMELYGRKKFWLKKFNNKLECINQFVFVSNALYEDGIRKCKVPEDKSMVIANGIVIKDTIILNNNDNIKFVLATRLVKNKNIDLALKALTALKETGLKFVCDIYGDGPEEENLKTFILSNHLEDFVILKGYNSNIDELLFKYDYYISASLFEGMPLGPLEAINNNVIPILSNIPTHREIIPDNIDLFFNLEEKSDLVNKILETINMSNTQIVLLRKKLRENVVNKYDVNIRFKKFLNLFESLMQ